MKYISCLDPTMRDLTDLKLSLARQAARVTIMGWANGEEAGALLERATDLIEQAQALFGPEAEGYARKEREKGRK